MNSNHQKKIPSVVFIYRTMAPPGTKNYCHDEVMALLRLLEKHLPVGPDAWEQVAEIHANNWTERGVESIRRKYNLLHRKKAPTGSPNIPPAVFLARKVKNDIANKVNMGDSEEIFDLTEGYPLKWGLQTSDGENESPSPPATNQHHVPVLESPDIVVKNETSTQVSSVGSTKRSYVSQQQRSDEILKSINTLAAASAERDLAAQKAEERAVAREA